MLLNPALVAPGVSHALVRALQSADNSHDYRLPPAGNDLEIDHQPYQLKGWLLDVESIDGIDKLDPFCKQIRRIECKPSQTVVDMLNLEFFFNEFPVWIEKKTHRPIFTYEAWDDGLEDENQRNRSYPLPLSEGWRLKVESTALQTFLQKSKFYLIAEVEITRKDLDYDYSRNDEDSKKKSSYARILLFEEDGTLCAAEGRLGTWLLSRK